MDRKSRIFAKLLSIILVFHPLTAFALDVRSDFNPNILIADATFSDTQTFGGPEGIQHFLESKNSVLANTDQSFLTMLHEPTDRALKQSLDDPGANLGRLRTAAELIWDVSRITGINPQVILVTLQKEQGLVTNSIDASRIQRALNHAMGFDCPDATGCGNLFPGFYFQLFGNVDTEGNRYLGAPRSLMKSFSSTNGRGPDQNGTPARVGQTIALGNTLGDYAGILKQQMVTIGNRATAALYRYTPHVFNGNYNFWNFFTSWFKYRDGTLLTSSQDGALYIIENGTRQRVPAFVVRARALNIAHAINLSPTELENYPIGPLFTPPDNTIVALNGTQFVFLSGVMHPASAFVIVQRRINPVPLAISSEDFSLFSQGSQLTPNNGSIIRGKVTPTVYRVEGGILKQFSEFTFKQRNAAKELQVIPEEEIALYEKQGYVAPLDGTLVQASSGNDIYLVNEGRRLPVPSILFKNRGFIMKNVVRLTTNAEIASIPIGPPATPKEGTYFALTGSPELYLFKGGTKHPVFPLIAKQRGIKADYSFDASIASSWSDGIAIVPIDGTLLKSDAAAMVYLVSKGQLHPVPSALAKNLEISPKQVMVFPDAQMEALPKGDDATPRENSYYRVTETKELFVFKGGLTHRIIPFVVTQRGMTPDFAFSQVMTDTWPEGDPIPPRDGTLIGIKGGATTYLVSLGKLRPLTAKAFKRRGYTNKQIKLLTKTEIELFAMGDPLVK